MPLWLGLLIILVMLGPLQYIAYRLGLYLGKYSKAITDTVQHYLGRCSGFGTICGQDCCVCYRQAEKLAKPRD